MPKLLTQGVSSEPKTGRQLIGIVAGFKSERWPVIDRNAGRLQLGIRTRERTSRRFRKFSQLQSVRALWSPTWKSSACITPKPFDTGENDS